jgi:adenosine kinase
MKIVSGSLVLDSTKKFPGEFGHHILPEDIASLNVSFTVDEKWKSWGGTGGNIAYNLSLLGGEVILISAIGRDGNDYISHLQRMGIETKYIYRDTERESASCDLITDNNHHQINSYYAGPTDQACNIRLEDIEADNNLAIISPSTRKVMLKHLQECAALGFGTIFDPGQQITSFSGEDLRFGIDHAMLLFGNKYEMLLLEDHSGWKRDYILSRRKTILTTYGKDGCIIENRDVGKITIPACKNIKAVDPTGAGDALRGGFMTGYEKGHPLDVCAQLGSVLASFAIETRGTQEHHFSCEDFIARYEQNYATIPKLIEKQLRLAKPLKI